MHAGGHDASLSSLREDCRCGHSASKTPARSPVEKSIGYRLARRSPLVLALHIVCIAKCRPLSLCACMCLSACSAVICRPITQSARPASKLWRSSSSTLVSSSPSNRNSHHHCHYVIIIITTITASLQCFRQFRRSVFKTKVSLPFTLPPLFALSFLPLLPYPSGCPPLHPARCMSKSLVSGQQDTPSFCRPGVMFISTTKLPRTARSVVLSSFCRWNYTTLSWYHK